MKLILTPQHAHNLNLTYEVKNQVLTLTLNGVSDTFDFTDLPDGVASGFESTLEINPILYAQKENSEVTVHMIYWYDKETDEVTQVRTVEL